MSHGLAMRSINNNIRVKDWREHTIPQVPLHGQSWESMKNPSIVGTLAPESIVYL